MSEGELKEYIADDRHGLHQHTVKNDISVDVFYKPSQIVWKDEIAAVTDTNQRKQIEQGCDTLTYFSLYFSRDGKEIENAYVSNPTIFNDIVNYLSFEIFNDLYLVADHDTTKAIDAVYTRTFGAGIGTGVMVTFNANLKNIADDKIKLLFDDQMFDTGLNEFTFNASDIKKTPTLIIK